jgi:hypothetical protein
MDSVFSTQIRAGLRKIPGFGNHVIEIVKNLSVLNDDAYDVFMNNKSNLSVAFSILSAKLRECTPDSPENAEYLIFNFLTDNGNNELVECSPHTKLIRKDSNLRIYFYWCHKRVGGGKKVLIGKIGPHPYP